jgi:adenine-specific DNA-methyltransferase
MYAGKVDCIYIDPPYNTGKEEWRYNDNVNSPMIREWLDSNPVNKDDMLRHDKWCALMWPRLRMLHELLSETGVIFVSIDDNELYHLRKMMDEIFGETDWIGTIVWKNVTDNNPTNIAIEHEYVVCFAKDKALIEAEWKSSVSDVKDVLIEIGDRLGREYGDDTQGMQTAYTKWFRENRSQLWPLDRYKYIDKDGVYTGSQSVHNPGKEGYRYDVIHPVTKKPCKQPLMGYRFPKDTMDGLLADDKILFGEDEDKIIELKVYARAFKDKLPSVIQYDGRTGAYELRDLFPGQDKAFDNPKPVQLIEQLLSFTAKPGSLVLDSFAGSGTTAHAVSVLNAADDSGSGRRYILVECEDYADDLTRERVARVIHGVPSSKNQSFRKGLGGSFTYCTLGQPLELDKLLTGETLPTFDALGAVLYHMATSEPFDSAKAHSVSLGLDGHGYLGEAAGAHIWLIYQPDLEFLKSRDAALTLEKAKKMVELLPGKRHVVYAPARFVSQKMLRDLELPVEFAPLPFALYRMEVGQPA